MINTHGSVFSESSGGLLVVALPVPRRMIMTEDRGTAQSGSGDASIKSSRFKHSNTAATRPLPIERAIKSDLVTILAVYQQHYSNTNACSEKNSLEERMKQGEDQCYTCKTFSYNFLSSSASPLLAATLINTIYHGRRGTIPRFR